MASKILFVHHNIGPCQIILDALSRFGFETILASSIETAKEIVLNLNVKVILADKELVDGSGFDILNFTRRLSSIPFILISECLVSEDQEKAKLLNFASLSKPIAEKDLFDTLGGLVLDDGDTSALLSQGQYVDSFENFSSVCIDEFISGKEIKYDVFINIGSGQFIMIAHGSDGFTDDQILRLKAKGVTSFYMRRKDFHEYIAMTVNLINGLSKIKITDERKSLFIHHASKLMSKSLLAHDNRDEAILHAKAVVDSTLSMLIAHDEILLSLELLKNKRQDVFAHSLNVALYSVLIARNLNWTSYQTQSKLAAAGIFHDIGKTQIPDIILQIPKKDLTAFEEKTLEDHVDYGVQILKLICGFPEGVVHIIEQHHEEDPGTGYPAGTKRGHLDPLARVVRVADEFCELISGRQPNLTNIMYTIVEMQNAPSKFDSQSVLALRAFFKRLSVKISA